jgi:tripartite-type tricarboxylate transporter receptor subunit TctC
MTPFRIFAAAAVAALAMTFASAAIAAWPEKTLKIVVPYPAGGTTDVLARSIGQKLSERLGQPVVIENRAGAGGTIGSALVAQAEPDGYTFVLGTIGTHGVNYAMNEKLAYHPLRDFVGVFPIASVPNVLVVRPDAPYKTFADLIADAKKRPGVLNHGSSGIGASPQLSLHLLMREAGIVINEVMYRGSAPVISDLLGGHVTIAFDAVATSAPHIKAGTLRPLAVSSKNRLKALPDVPAISETFPDYDVVAWYALWAPKGTPKDIVKRLNAEINDILRTPDLQSQMADAGAELMGGPADEFQAMHKREFDRWYAFIKQIGLTTN